MKSSVLLSTYCGSQFLRPQLDSIINQSRKVDEIILVDDCSPDDGKTRAIIEEYCNKYKCIRKVFHEKNKGWERAFMEGISFASGDIVFFADQDDIWNLHKIEKMMEIFEKEPNINAVISACTNADINLKPMDNLSYSGMLIKDYFKFNTRFIYPKGVGAAMGIRKSFLDEYKFCWNQTMGHDRYFQVMLMLFDNLYYLDEALLVHRMHGNNATGKKDFSCKNRVLSVKGNLEFLNALEESGLYSQIDGKKRKVILGYIKFANRRIKMLEKKSIMNWLLMPMANLRYYPTRNTWFGDLKAICSNAK